MVGATHPPSTQNVVFRLWNDRDIEAFYEVCSDREVMRYVAEGEPWSRSRVREFVRREMESQRTNGFCRWALEDRDGGALIGFCGFVADGKAVAMGWRLARCVWGRGIATEAAGAALAFAKEQFPSRAVSATVHAANKASRRVAEKLGMRETDRIYRESRWIIRYIASE